MIEVQNLSKDYGPISAIHKLNFSINKGEVVGFLGPNGAGKSTTMKIITGFMAPTTGIAKVCGYDVFENPLEVKKRIGYLPETPPLYGEMFVADFLRYVARLKQVEKNKIEKQVQLALEKTNLVDVKNRVIDHLSKGFKQRVGIAQALVSDPEVLILDEPTVGLDPKQMHEVRQLILDLKGQHTIILSTHILSEVQAVCEKVIIINKGQIVAEDSIANLSLIDKGQTKFRMRLRQGLGAKEKDLRSCPGVLQLLAGDSSNEWLVSIQGGEEQVEAFTRKVVESGLGLLEMTPARKDLEDVFIQLTYGQQAKG